jgi:hypothetical protein
VTPDQLLSWAQLGVAVATLVGFLKSWLNGAVRDALDAVERIPSIEQKVDEQAVEMRDTRDAVIALSYSQQHESVEIDPRELSGKLRGEENPGPARFFSDADIGPRPKDEDDESN